ncbi:MAG: hypothetical protein HOP23_05610 [Methylococcaceae bacterium]|nr:hypothetical protein [Methylococcaceae bacterium]
MGILAGALTGFGKGLREGSDLIIENNEKLAKEARDNQGQIDKERRIEEAFIRQEGRTAQARKDQLTSNLEFTTDPTNVSKVAEAELQKKTLTDAYADERSPIEIQQAADMAAAKDKATYHDTTDYEGRRQTHELNQLKIDEAKKPTMSKTAGKQYDFLKLKYGKLIESKRELIKAKSDVSLDAKGRAGLIDDIQDVDTQLSIVERSINTLLSASSQAGVNDEEIIDVESANRKKTGIMPNNAAKR